MTTKTARKRRRRERQLQEMPLTARATRALGRFVSPGRLAVLGVGAAAIVGAIFLAQALGGNAEPGRVTGPVRNERTQGLAARPEIGQLAPNFEAQDVDGNVVRLSGFQGKPVILNFWATWCTSCRAEIPALQRVYEERKGNGLAVIGIDWGEGRVDAAKNYMNDLGATYAIAMDPNGDIGEEYRVRGLPITMAPDGDGVIREIVAGEVDYQGFSRLAELAMGSARDAGGEIAPVRDIQSQDGAGG